MAAPWQRRLKKNAIWHRSRNSVANRWLIRTGNPFSRSSTTKGNRFTHHDQSQEQLVHKDIPILKKSAAGPV